MKILIYGIGGKMGGILYEKIAASKTDSVCCGVDKYADKSSFPFPVYDDCTVIAEKPDCIIDFSVKEAVYDYLPYAVKNSVPCVIATTGHTENEESFIIDAAKKIPVFKSGNMSRGVNLLIKLIKTACKYLGDDADVEIVETHHRRKKDAPSGTALMLAKAVKSVATDTNFVFGRNPDSKKREKGDLGISAVRGGTVVGKHEVSFFMDDEVITLTHEAENRAIFAEGSIEAAHYLADKNPGLYDTMDF